MLVKQRALDTFPIACLSLALLVAPVNSIKLFIPAAAKDVIHHPAPLVTGIFDSRFVSRVFVFVCVTESFEFYIHVLFYVC